MTAETAPPLPSAPTPKTGWRFVVAKSADEARSGTAYVIAVTSLIVWAVQYFGFHGNMPGAVSAALYVVIPTTMGYLATHVTVKKVTL
jgi:hypothetical protein